MIAIYPTTTLIPAGTYVRRLYRKLEITNRADLTRKCSQLSLC